MASIILIKNLKKFEKLIDIEGDSLYIVTLQSWYD